MTKDVTIILPTFNERENLAKLLPEVIATGYRVVVVDDNSPDGTAEVAKQYPSVDTLVRRFDRGLGSAIRDGARAATTPFVAVMDTDGQHSLQHLLKVIETRALGDADVAIGSRLLPEGGIEGLSRKRMLVTRTFNWIASLRAKTKASDYLTGMFCARKELVVNTQGVGFKILFEILKKNDLRMNEAPMVLYERVEGESKANWVEAKRFLQLVFTR